MMSKCDVVFLFIDGDNGRIIASNSRREKPEIIFVAIVILP